MHIKRILSFLLLFIIVLCEPVDVFACGPFFTTVNFTETQKPGNPLQHFIKGSVGILFSTFDERYLNLAYNYLVGHNFTFQEQDSIRQAWEPRTAENVEESEGSALTQWKHSRYLADGASQFYPMIDQYFTGEIRPGEYASYLNISDDALLHASETLTRRVQEFGKYHPAVVDWRNTQDQIFKIANSGGTTPDMCDATFPTVFQYDRFYQIASAHFYLRNFDLAEKVFQELSQDQQNQRAKLCRYMVARTLIRKGTLVSSDWNVVDTLVLKQASQNLHAIINDSTMKEFHNASQRSLNFINTRIHPDIIVQTSEKKFLSCSNEVLLSYVDPPSNEYNDYVYVCGGMKNELTLRSLVENRIKAARRNRARKDEKSDWIWCFQSNDSSDFQHSVQQWHNNKGSEAWFIIVISKVDTASNLIEEVLDHATKISPKSLSYPTVSFFQVRLLVDLGKIKDARAISKKILHSISKDLPNSSLNFLLTQRLNIAQSLDEVFTFSQQLPATFEYPELSERSTDYSRFRFFINGFSKVNKFVPTEILAHAVYKNLFKQNLSAETAMAVWVRSILLHQDSIAIKLALILESRLPELKNEFQKYIKETDPASRRFQAIYLIMKNPGSSPLIREGYGRSTLITKIDDLRDNWWGRMALQREFENEESFSKRLKKFLTEHEQKKGKMEYESLLDKTPAFSLFSNEAIRWATLHRDDPRSPEALFLAIRASRYSQDKTNNIDNSKAAFDLLHKQYPNSSWAKKAPYWY